MGWGGVGWGGAITFIGTYTHTWCYATARSSATSTHTWCYATALSSATSAHTWCYATARSSATSTHTWCYAGEGCGRVGWGGAITFIGTYTHTWCYATARSSATSTHTWCYATALSSATSAHTWCYATARSNKKFHESESENFSICEIVPMAVGKPTRVVEDNCDIHQATVLIRLRASWRRNNAERIVDGKVKPSSSETPFFQSNLTFRYGETII